jgi:hypothetical protein
VRHFRYTCTFVLLALLLAGAYAYAQTATGDIVGKVTDAQGAVIVKAKVTATETATGLVRTGSTNAEGFYEFVLLPPGKYEVTAEAPSMAKGVIRLELLVGTQRTVNLVLQPAGAATTVEVSGEAPAIETTSSDLKANVDPRQMADMPLNGRTFASLAILAPEVRPVGSFDPTKSRIGTVSIGGSTGRNFNLTVDGGDNKDNIVGGFLQNYTTEGIQEFVIDTHKFGADTGKSSGGVLIIATKGGSNTLHGGAFFYMRNRNLNAMDFFTSHPNSTNPSTGDPVPCPPCFTSALYPDQAAPYKAPFDRQNYGGSISGPLKKDKLFFFSSVEHQKEMNAVAQNGDALQSLRDFVALREIAPSSYPEIQNMPISLNPSVPVPFLDTQFQGRVDWNINAKNQIFFRYGQQNNHLDNDQLTGWGDISNGATTINDLNSMLVNWTTTLSSTKLNQFVFQYSHFYNAMMPTPTGLNTTEICFNAGACIGQNENVPQTTTQNKYQFRDDFSWRLNKHALKFGFQDVYTPEVGGTIAYDVTPWVYLHDSAADLLASGTSIDQAIVSSVGLAGGDPSYMETGVHQISFYFQDDWKATPRLTLNLGIRNDIDYNLMPTTQQRHNRAVEILTAIGMDPGIPSTDTNNWAPRFGFAYDVTGKGNWVIRGGYGWFFDQIFLNTLLQSIPQANPDMFGVLSSNNYGIEDGVTVVSALDSLVSTLGMWPITHMPNLPYGGRGRYFNSNFQTPYNQQFTIGTQMQLRQDMTLAVDYVHSLGLHEFAQRDTNPRQDGTDASRILYPLLDPVYGCQQSDGSIVYPGPGETTCSGLHRVSRMQQMTSDSRSRYDSLTFNLQKRFSNRFSFGASYVLARALSYGGQASDWGNEAQGVYPGLTGWQTALKGIIGPQNFRYSTADERHRVVLNGIFELPAGFTVSGIAQFSSARPYYMYSDGDNNGDGVWNDLYSNVMNYDPVYDPLGYGDARLALPANDLLRGDPYYQTDLRVQKIFKFGERFKMSLVADMFNVFNRVNFGSNFQNYADSFGAQQVDVPANSDCPGSVYPCTYPTAKQLPRKPTSLFGGGLGGAGTIGIPFQAQFGLRFSF